MKPPTWVAAGDQSSFILIVFRKPSNWELQVIIAFYCILNVFRKPSNWELLCSSSFILNVFKKPSNWDLRVIIVFYTVHSQEAV
jgi:hypothetical protein